MLQCPYCAEERPSRARLQSHVDQVHYFADTQPRRADAVAAVVAANQCESTISSGFDQTYHCPQTKGHQGDHGDPKGSPRWKNDATQSFVDAANQAFRDGCFSVTAVAEDVSPGIIAIVTGEPVSSEPRCVCGARVSLDSSVDEGTYLAHVFGGNKGCTDPRLANNEPTPQDRAALQATWDRVGKGLDRAGKDMAEMRAALDAVDERMRKLDAELTKPSVVRRATLNQVWDRLLEAGHLAAAREVMKMIERVVD